MFYLILSYYNNILLIDLIPKEFITMLIKNVIRLSYNTINNINYVIYHFSNLF